MTEEKIKMAAKLYKCRDTAKSFFKEKYKENLQPYTRIVKEVMKANNLEEIPALLKISETHVYQDSAMGQMMFMAAVVELMEPSKCEVCGTDIRRGGYMGTDMCGVCATGESEMLEEQGITW